MLFLPVTATCYYVMFDCIHLSPPSTCGSYSNSSPTNKAVWVDNHTAISVIVNDIALWDVVGSIQLNDVAGNYVRLEPEGEWYIRQ